MDWTLLSDQAILETLGKRLKESRLRMNLTQRELAEHAGISLFTVTQIENGKSVSFSMIISVLRSLRMLDNLEMLVPEIKISPLELLKFKGETRKRASVKRK
jgi:putative transcriptional regulator